MGLDARKPVFGGFANNTGTDQPAHPHSLINAFVICVLECIISKLATSEILIFYLVSVAEETGLNLALLKPRRKVFSRRGPNHALRHGKTEFQSIYPIMLPSPRENFEKSY